MMRPPSRTRSSLPSATSAAADARRSMRRRLCPERLSPTPPSRVDMMRGHATAHESGLIAVVPPHLVCGVAVDSRDVHRSRGLPLSNATHLVSCTTLFIAVIPSRCPSAAKARLRCSCFALGRGIFAPALMQAMAEQISPRSRRRRLRERQRTFHARPAMRANWSG
jgi:hypothetical protein